MAKTETYPKQKVEKFHSFPRKKAVRLIKEYISTHRGCRTSEMLSNLHLDPELVLEVLTELKKAGKIRSEELV
jgi:hypothetical protein